jgi:hypothetical protein
LVNLVHNGSIAKTLCCIVYLRFRLVGQGRKISPLIIKFHRFVNFLFGHLALRRKVQQVCSPANGSLKIQFFIGNTLRSWDDSPRASFFPNIECLHSKNFSNQGRSFWQIAEANFKFQSLNGRLLWRRKI